MSLWLYLHNKPQLYMCTPHPEPPPQPSPPYSPGLSKSISFGGPAPCTELALVIYFAHGNAHVSMPFSQSSHPCPLPLTPKVYSLSLCLPCCPEQPFLVVQLAKNLPANEEYARDKVSIPGLGRSPGKGNGYPLQYYAWEIPWTEERGGPQFMG